MQLRLADRSTFTTVLAHERFSATQPPSTELRGARPRARTGAAVPISNRKNARDVRGGERAGDIERTGAATPIVVRLRRRLCGPRVGSERPAKLSDRRREVSTLLGERARR